MNATRFAIGLLAISLVLPAWAGQYSQALSQCLVQSAQPQERELLTQWAFVSAGSNPALRPYLAANKNQIDNLNKQAAHIFTQLLTSSCRQQTQQALLHEGLNSLKYSFNALGETTGKQLMNTPEVSHSMLNMTKYIDMRQLLSLAN